MYLEVEDRPVRALVGSLGYLTDENRVRTPPISFRDNTRWWVAHDP